MNRRRIPTGFVKQTMMNIVGKLTRSVILGFTFVCASTNVDADTRTVEFRFQLSADAGSEFSARIPVLSSGFLAARADWTSVAPSGPATPAQARLLLILVRPDGTEAARTSGPSPLSFEIRVSENDVVRFSDKARAWSIKIINGASERPAEVNGTLRATVPVTAGILIDTNFTLLGNGNAQELPFTVSGPGRLLVEANWQADGNPVPSGSALLSVSLIHLGDDRIYARRHGASPLRIEHAVNEQILDRGHRWSVRLLNDGRNKLKGSVKVTFVPGL